MMTDRTARTDPTTLPAIRDWLRKWTSPRKLWDYLTCECGATAALAFASFFYPRFIEVRGCVLLAEHYEPDNFEHWWNARQGDTRAIEAVLNHVHLSDMFNYDEEGIPGQAMMELAEILRDCWRCALQKSFPGREFELSVSDDGGGPVLTFTSRPAG